MFTDEQKDALRKMTLAELLGLLGSPMMDELARRLEPTPREVLEQVAALLEQLPRVDRPYLLLDTSGGGHDGHAAILEAGGEALTSVYPDGTALDGASLTIGVLEVRAQLPQRKATAEEIAAKAARLAALVPPLTGSAS